MNPNQRFDEAWKALGDADVHLAIEQKRANLQHSAETAAMILIARVTVGDETLVVRATGIAAALTALHGAPKAGMRVEARIEFDAMTPAEFAAVPDYQQRASENVMITLRSGASLNHSRERCA
jgi:hypothetical protein